MRKIGILLGRNVFIASTNPQVVEEASKHIEMLDRSWRERTDEATRKEMDLHMRKVAATVEENDA